MFVKPITFFRNPQQQELTVSADQVDYNIYTGIGSPSQAIWATVTIDAGVTISASSTSTPALRTGVFPVGSRLTIINNGMITGAGGDGGDGGFPTLTPGQPGSAGGRAILLEMDATIENNGTIQGGGGGGGGSTSCTAGGVSRKGCPGGGGAGMPGGQPGAFIGSVPAGITGPAAGTLTAGGIGAFSGTNFYPPGGDGGDPGVAGEAGDDGTSIGCSSFITGAGAGGAAGKAVDLNGVYMITWNPMGTVHGAVS